MSLTSPVLAGRLFFTSDAWEALDNIIISALYILLYEETEEL